MHNQNNSKFETPILFLIFNRPNETRKVFEEIKKLKPAKLFVAADGPRINKPAEKKLCEESRVIVNDIDWDCDVKLLFREKNLGCGPAISQAITWFFSQVEYGIILEDDCLPHEDFFPFCEELLKKYKNHEKVMFIGGDNFQNNYKHTDTSYYFSSFNHVWGWATWKYVWDKYDYNLRNISFFKLLFILIRIFKFSLFPILYFLIKYIYVKRFIINTWDYQLTFTIWGNNALSVIPEYNLVTNIGIGQESTHTRDNSIGLSVPLYRGTIFPLIYNNNVSKNNKADRYFFKNLIANQFFKKYFK